MSKLEIPLIEKTLDTTFEEEGNGVMLTDEQALAVEAKLSENATTIQTDAKERKESETKISALEASEQKLTKAVQKALADADVENAKEMSNEKGIEALSALITTYGAENGGTNTETYSDGKEAAFVCPATEKLQETINNL